MSARAASAPPDIPGYRHLELLGMGGFADVFLYEQRSMGGRKVAVKVLLQGLRGDLQQAFEDEARAMARLSNHPSIVSVFDAGQTPDGRAYLVMEHCPGAHLGTQVKSRPLNLAKALEVAIQVSGAVETAHAASIVHRDIKPANILFTEFNRPALTDFGISASTTAVQGKAVGVSVPWAPPEQLAAGSQTGVTGDVYSLGATLYTALVGHPPFWKPQGPNDNMSMSSRIVNDLLPPIHRDDAPPSLQRVLEVAMSKRPSQRYPTALEFARALQQVQLELHLPVTAADVRAELAQVEVDDETEAGGTIAAGFVTIEATPTKSATGFDSRSGSGFTGSTAHVNTTDLERDGLVPQVIRHGRGSAESMGPIEFTGPVPPSLDDGHTVLSTDLAAPEATEANPTPVPAKRRAALWAVLAVIVLVLAIGTIVLIPKGSGDAATQNVGTTTPSVKPVDPVGEVVPQVTDLKVVNDGGTVTVTWTNPSPLPGDNYLYRVVDPAVTTKSYESTTETKATVKAIPGRTCVEVILGRRSGRSSDPNVKCDS
jgi:serine/threonine protein kinase